MQTMHEGDHWEGAAPIGLDRRLLCFFQNEDAENQKCIE